MGIFFLMANIFTKIHLLELFKELPAFMLNKTIILTVMMLLIRCSSIKIQGLSRTKMNKRDFQGLSRP